MDILPHGELCGDVNISGADEGALSFLALGGTRLGACASHWWGGAGWGGETFGSPGSFTYTNLGRHMGCDHPPSRDPVQTEEARNCLELMCGLDLEVSRQTHQRQGKRRVK